MRATVVWGGALLLLTLSSLARGEQSGIGPPPADAGPGVAALSLVFDESAASLPQADIRIAVEQAVGLPVALEVSPGRPTLRVSVAPDGSLLLTYQRPASSLERRLAGPQRADQIPLLLGLAAGSLVRNQADDLAPRTEPPSKSEPAAGDSRTPPAPVARPARAPAQPPVARVETGRSSAPFTNWLGLHVGIDLVPLSASSACTSDSRANDHLVCFRSDGSTFSGQPNPRFAGAIGGGLTLATVPVLLSYEHLFGSFGVEARAGYAFNGGPQATGASPFLPVRVELRGKFWPLGPTPATPAFRPYVHLGAGVAQVDATVHDVTIGDCAPARSLTPPRDGFFDGCLAANSLREARAFGGEALTVTVVKSLGLAYFTAGGGVTYAIADGHAIVLNLNLTMLLPSSGFALEPSIGYQVGM